MDEIKKPWYKKWWGILIIILLSIFLVIVIIFGLYVLDILLNTKLQNPSSGEEGNDNIELILGSKSNYSIGTNNPLITIVEFADYACPYCQRSFPTIREISSKYQDNVKIIFRDYPVVTDYSVDLALAARCAGDQSKFWPMHDQLFLNTDISGYDDILNIAKRIKLDTNKFNTCFNNKKFLSDINKDFNDAKELGLTGTPTWFINGYKIEGNIPRDIFIEIIEGLLKELDIK